MPIKSLKVAVVVTCFNRREKTLKCLESMRTSLEDYNSTSNRNIDLHLYLTDDGCTDGTAEAVKKKFETAFPVSIIKGEGNLYWAGGMRKAWERALDDKEGNHWDYYLLINDDTVMLPSMFKTLLNDHDWLINKYGKGGLISGICKSSVPPIVTTYGGKKYIGHPFGRSRFLDPTGEPQKCDVTNANILLVDSSFVDKFGVFYKGFRHGNADFDYSYQAKKKGYPVILTSEYCGVCDNDHGGAEENKEKLINMSLRERWRYFHNPLHSSSDYLVLLRRNAFKRYIVAFIYRQIHVFLPTVYYKLPH